MTLTCGHKQKPEWKDEDMEFAYKSVEVDEYGAFPAVRHVAYCPDCQKELAQLALRTQKEIDDWLDQSLDTK